MQRIANADAFFAATGANVVHGGSRACYVPSTDNIHMPCIDFFRDAEICLWEQRDWHSANFRIKCERCEPGGAWPRIVRNDGEGKTIEGPVVVLRKVGRDDPFADLRVPRDITPKQLDGAPIEALQEKLYDLFGWMNGDLLNQT